MINLNIFQMYFKLVKKAILLVRLWPSYTKWFFVGRNKLSCAINAAHKIYRRDSADEAAVVERINDNFMSLVTCCHFWISQHLVRRH